MISDFHNDILMSNINAEKYIKDIKSGDIVVAVWTTELGSVDDKISLALENYKYVGIEDCGFVCENNMERFLSITPVYYGLVWNNANSLGGGANTDIGLTALGKKFVKELEKFNKIIDIAHMSGKTFEDIVSLGYCGGMVCSHTALRCKKNIQRNISDSMISEIIARNGMVGLTLVGSFLRDGKANADDFLAEIDTFVSRYGYDNLVIGSDYFGTSDIPIGLENYDLLYEAMQKLENYGYSQVVIDSICYKNLTNFLKSCTMKK